MYDHESTSLQDYHPNQEPIREAHIGQGFVTNALVSNYNHTQEHFDYITEIFDNDGKTVYLHVRYGVAVNLGGKIPIDSSKAPIILEPGIYLVKVFPGEMQTIFQLPFGNHSTEHETIIVLYLLSAIDEFG